jgi:hypothetical protein
MKLVPLGFMKDGIPRDRGVAYKYSAVPEVLKE